MVREQRAAMKHLNWILKEMTKCQFWAQISKDHSFMIFTNLVRIRYPAKRISFYVEKCLDIGPPKIHRLGDDTPTEDRHSLDSYCATSPSPYRNCATASSPYTK